MTTNTMTNTSTVATDGGYITRSGNVVTIVTLGTPVTTTHTSEAAAIAAVDAELAWYAALDAKCRANGAGLVEVGWDFSEEEWVRSGC